MEGLEQVGCGDDQYGPVFKVEEGRVDTVQVSRVRHGWVSEGHSAVGERAVSGLTDSQLVSVGRSGGQDEYECGRSILLADWTGLAAADAARVDLQSLPLNESHQAASWQAVCRSISPLLLRRIMHRCFIRRYDQSSRIIRLLRRLSSVVTVSIRDCSSQIQSFFGKAKNSVSDKGKQNFHFYLCMFGVLGGQY